MREKENREVIIRLIELAILKHLRAGEIITAITIIELLKSRVYEEEENNYLLNSDYNIALKALEELTELGHLRVVTIRATKQKCYLKV